MGESADNGSAEEEQGIAGELDRSDVVNVSNITNDPNYEDKTILQLSNNKVKVKKKPKKVMTKKVKKNGNNRK